MKILLEWRSEILATSFAAIAWFDWETVDAVTERGTRYGMFIAVVLLVIARYNKISKNRKVNENDKNDSKK